LHPEIGDEPLESQIERVSLSFGQIVPPLESREKHPEIPRLEKFETLEPPQWLQQLLPQSLQLEQPWSASNQRKVVWRVFRERREDETKSESIQNASSAKQPIRENFL